MLHHNDKLFEKVIDVCQWTRLLYLLFSVSYRKCRLHVIFLVSKNLPQIGIYSQDTLRPKPLYTFSDFFGENSPTIHDIAEVICRGGWPNAVVSKDKTAQTARNYVEAVINTDVQRVDGVDRNPHRVRALLRSYARNISTLAATSTIMADIQANDTSISENTVYSYINALERDFPHWWHSCMETFSQVQVSYTHFIQKTICRPFHCHSRNEDGTGEHSDGFWVIRILVWILGDLMIPFSSSSTCFAGEHLYWATLPNLGNSQWCCIVSQVWSYLILKFLK